MAAPCALVLAGSPTRPNGSLGHGLQLLTRAPVCQLVPPLAHDPVLLRNPRPTGPRAGALGPQYGRFLAPCYMQQKIDMVATRGAESMVVV